METTSLTRDAWLDAALDALREDGYPALKAQRLARRLNVTRGSFYHHFESLADFQSAVVVHWSQHTTGPVVGMIEEYESPDAALRGLLFATLRSGATLERAVRSWATVSTAVATEVETVDTARIVVAEDLLSRAGVPAVAAHTRARLLYWSAIGRLMMPFPERNRLSDAEIAAIADLMLIAT